MKPYVLLVTSLILFLVACKKDKLEGDKSILIGKWEWTHSYYAFKQCDPPAITSTLTPESESTNYSIEFHEKGKVDFLVNEAVQESYRVVCGEYWGTPGLIEGYIYSNINLNGNENNKLDGYIINQDTLMIIRGFPYYDPEDNCENYTNYFVRK
ncbi:hypothetical protein JYT72_00050 [Crocinitomix catalasitica]|nr:hypothetical protein [Crocinitomix catalasitica]